jgi:FkbM family methyltransferase
MNNPESSVDRRQDPDQERINSETTTSYFGEDILLRRLLKTTSSGTYVDVGCNHPVTGSNTFGLYLDGWSGLSIDPNPKFAPDFRRIRPRDVHVVAGIAAEPGCLTYHMFDPDVFNTLSDAQASMMIAQNRRKVGEMIVPCIQLAGVVAEHLGSRPIDILNVDCEGMDLEVLQSLDLSVNRPTAIVVEDAAGLVALRDGGGRSGMYNFLRSHRYSPVAQSAWSAIFVANDWRTLAKRSDAFDRQSMERGYMPR